ncbi:MAG: putative porin [Thermodesulfobacteriota bacterium]|nr:putative porin [Thermodesulfobacteriota bacterium]
MRYRGILIVGLSLLFCFLHVSFAICEEGTAVDQETDSIEALINILKEKGVMDDAEAGKFIERHRKEKVLAPKRDEERIITIVPEEKEEAYIEKITKDVAREIKQDVQEQVKLEIKDEVTQAADWTQRIRFGGDVRLRYEGDFFDKNNADLAKPEEPTELMNTKHDRHRARYRVRINMKARVNDKVDFAARLTTGNEEDPVSTNDTLGDYMINDNLVFDRAYLHFRPVEGLQAWGGRFPNPWFHTDLLWDPDMNFEGVAATFEKGLTKPWTGFLTLGAFPLQEVEFSSKDKWLFGGQLGTQWDPSEKFSAKIGVAYYDYQRTVGKVNDPFYPHEYDSTAPLYQQKGNTLMDIDPSEDILTALASEFKELNITGKLDIGVFDPVHVIFIADYVKNLGFDRDDVAERTGNPDVEEEDEGYQLGLIVGHEKTRRFGEWNTFFYYKHLEADAVVDAFTESDFHLGGTNAEGWILGGHLGLADNLWGRIRWMTADEINGPPLAIDVLQVDVNASF